jgi:WD40 repeat protein
MATASSDTTVRLWNSTSGAPISTLRGQSASVECTVFESGGGLLACGAGDGSICIYDFAHNGEFTLLRAHAKDIASMAINRQGVLASGSWDNTAKLWNMPTIQEALTLEHPDWLRALAFTSDGSGLLTACKDGLWRRWDVRTGELLHSAFGHEGGIDTIVCSPDGALLATGGRDCAIRLWDATNTALLATLTGHDKPVLTLAFHPGGQFVISGSGDNTLRLWGIPA